jgi:hypothetical protein
MNELLRKRLERHLENLTDQQGYQLLDYVEFLETRYGTGTRAPSTFERVTEGVEDAMRVGRLPAAAIRETMHAMDSASRLLQRLAEAGKSAVDELGRSLAETERAAQAEATGEPPPPSEEPPPPA